MHNLINIFARLQWLSRPSWGLFIPPKHSGSLLGFHLVPLFLAASYYNNSFPPFTLAFSPALPKGPMLKNHHSLQSEETAVWLGWGLYVHEVQPCTQRAGQKSTLCFSPVMWFFLHSYPLKKAYITKKRQSHNNLANAEITGVRLGIKYYCINVIFPAESPPDIGPSLLPLAAAGLTDHHLSICVYIYIYIIYLIYFEK